MTAAERAMTPAEPKSEALRALYWRDEILQVMFWLRGEGFGDHADAPLIERFLGVDANIGIGYLDRLVEEGYLIRDAAHYRLTEQGIEQGGRIFSEEFAEFMRPTHGECGPDCWCHSSAEDAVSDLLWSLDPGVDRVDDSDEDPAVGWGMFLDDAEDSRPVGLARKLDVEGPGLQLEQHGEQFGVVHIQAVR